MLKHSSMYLPAAMVSSLFSSAPKFMMTPSLGVEMQPPGPSSAVPMTPEPTMQREAG